MFRRALAAPTHVAPPAGDSIRGNLTTASQWLDTAGAFISSTSTYFDTGMKATSADPLLHTTSYTYSSTFLGAYLTQTNMPDTQMPDSGAPVVHHIISGNYDFNTGVLTNFTDENGQPYSYTYDVMLRLTQGNHPDSGITKFFYPDPNTVERQRLIYPAQLMMITKLNLTDWAGLIRRNSSRRIAPAILKSIRSMIRLAALRVFQIRIV